MKNSCSSKTALFSLVGTQTRTDLTRHAALTVWNSLSHDIRLYHSDNTFKRRLKASFTDDNYSVQRIKETISAVRGKSSWYRLDENLQITSLLHEQELPHMARKPWQFLDPYVGMLYHHPGSHHRCHFNS